MDDRPRYIALLAAVLVVAVTTAGCVGMPASGPPYDTPIDAQTIASDHQAALDEAGSYTITANTSVSLGGANSAGESTVVARIDETNQRANFSTTTAFGPISVYVDDDTLYQRIGDTDAQYQVQQRSVNVSSIGSPDVAGTVSNYSFVANGSTTLNGDTVWRYEANATGENASLPQNIGQTFGASTVDVTLYVRQDGLVVRQVTNTTIVDDSDQQLGSWRSTITYSEVGSTTVEEPDWLSEARNATTG